MPERVVFWDFDGTLAERPGAWSGCIIELLDIEMPGHGISRDAVRRGLLDGFPWDRPQRPHPELCDPQAWWNEVGEMLHGAMLGGGISADDARRLLPLFRQRYIDPAYGWRVYDDTLPALRATRAAGWSNVIISNHVPELGALVTGLGLGDQLDAVFSSALTGYEKPHPEAFWSALRACGEPRAAFMVGDNPLADVAGPEAIGLSAILVRGTGEARNRFDGLAGAVDLILSA